MSKYLQHKYNNLPLLVLTMLALLISGLISVNAQSVFNGDFEDLGEVITYPVQACYSQSTNYTLKVNGVAVPLLKHEYYPYTGAASKEFNVMFANFEFEGTAVIEIARGSGDITSVNISPKRLNIEYETPNTKSIKFAITEPRHLYLTINGAEILLFAEAKRTNKPNTSGTGIYNITDYGAASNSSTSVIQTTAIQNAINAASNAGGGIVYVPAGLYYIQALTLKQNVHIYLEGGAVLRGTGNKNDYTGYIAAGNKVLMFNGTSTTHKSNIKIYGPGIIDANGVSTADVDNLTDLYNKINLRGGPSIRIIDIRYASNITIEDVTCIEGTNWQVSFEEVDNLEVCRVKVIGHRTMKWNDGIDVGACQRVGIRNCFALGMDDNFCIKDEPNAPSEDITIENCMGYSHSRTFKIGFQSGNAVRRCNIKNIDVIRSRQACHFMQTNGTGAIWEDIHIDNFNIDNNLQASDPNDTFSASPFEIQLSLSGGVAKNVIVNNFTYSGDNWASSEYDSDLNENTTNTTIDNISFTNFKVGGNYATTSGEAKMGINGATNVTFAVNPSMVPPVIKNASIPV